MTRKEIFGLRALFSAAIAVGLVGYLVWCSPVSRVDRAVILVLIFSAYFLLFNVAALVTWALARVWTRFSRRDPSFLRREHLAHWDLLTGAGVMLLNQLAGIFGYKDFIRNDDALLENRLAQAVITLTCLTALCILWRLVGQRLCAFAAAHMRASFGTLLGSLLLVLCLPQSGTRHEFVTMPNAGLPQKASHKRPLVILAFDGVDWRLLRSLMASGKVPHVEHMVKRGFVSSLDHNNFGSSPIVWTSVITGKNQDAHGIHDFATLSSPLFQEKLDAWWIRVPVGFGIKSIFASLQELGLLSERVATGNDRNGPSVWQIVSKSGYRSLVVNYMMSFPAEKIHGAFFAQYLFHRLREVDNVQPSPITPIMRLPESGYEYPEGLLTSLGPHHVGEESNEEHPVEFAEEEFDFLRWIFAEMLARESFDLVTFYTHFPDSFNHQLSVEDYDAILARDFGSGGPARFASAYEKFDQLIGEVSEHLPSANVILLSDHGVTKGYNRRKILQHLYSPNGIFVAAGPDIAAGTRAEPVSMYDITPTLLYYFEMPIARDFDGRPVKQLFRESFDVTYIDSYETVVNNDRVETAFGAEVNSVKQRLRALGYIR